MNQGPPTADESMHIASLFLEAAMEHAHHGTDRAVEMIERYLDIDGDPQQSSLNLWYWVAVGPVIASAGIKRLNLRQPGEGEYWGIEHLPDGPEPSDGEASTLAAIQCVVAYLNDDAALAHDVTSAHVNVAGEEGLFEMVCEFLSLCSFLVKQGAFELT